MAVSLYQKYRPQKFGEIVGQDWIAKVLQKVLDEEKHSHAYLFTGGRGTGKTTTARIVAKSLNCLDRKKGEPCNKCTACIAINEGRFLDLIEIDAASNRGIDQIRDLKEKINFAPSEGKYKVYIIDETHMLTNEAFNALLKTLEEPPTHVVFILATTEPHKLPLTIISRTQRFDFKLANAEELKEKLEHISEKEKVKLEEEVLELVIQASGGSFRDSETILEKIFGSSKIVKDKKVTVKEAREILGLADQIAVEKMMGALLDWDIEPALSILEKVDKKGLSLHQFLRQLMEYGRQLIHEKVGAKKKVSSQEFELNNLIRTIKILSEASVGIKSAVIPILAFEMAIVEIGSIDSKKQKSTSKKKALKSEESEEIKEQAQNPKPKTQNNVSEDLKIEESEDAESHMVELEEVNKVWDKFLDKVKPENQHLLAFLAKAEPAEVKGENLVLKVPFRFHKDRIEKRESRKVISEVFKGLLNVALVPSCRIVTEMRVEEPEEEVEFNNAELVEEVFGDMMTDETLNPKP